jgi:predicted Zn-dependent protease
MLTHIFYEQGVEDNYLDATKLAHEALYAIGGAAPVISLKPLSLELPELATGQVDSAFINTVMPEAGVSALFITARDLGAVGLNFCFGRSAFNQRAAIVSSHRISDTTMFGLSLHELGHSVGLVGEDAQQYDRVSRFAGHCANTCVMEPVNSIVEMDAAVTKYIANPMTAGFCQPCSSDLAEL